MSPINLDPEVEARILEIARAGGCLKPLADQEFSAILDDLAMYADKIPSLPDQAYARDSIYQDHDFRDQN